MAYPTPPLLPAELLQFVADVLKRPLADLDVSAADESGRYKRQAAFYPQQAYSEVLGLLATQGYTASQFDASDQGGVDGSGNGLDSAHWVRDLAAWFILRDEANVPDAVKLQWQAEYDRREFIKTAVLTSGGQPVAPTATLRPAKYGAFDSSRDRWTRCSRI